MTKEELRLFKTRFGLSNARFAELLGLPSYMGKNGSMLAPTISQWLNGKSRPPPYLWRAIAHLSNELVNNKPQP